MIAFALTVFLGVIGFLCFYVLCVVLFYAIYHSNGGKHGLVWYIRNNI